MFVAFANLQRAACQKASDRLHARLQQLVFRRHGSHLSSRSQTSHRELRGCTATEAISGSSCGIPGYIRVAFADLDEAACQKAADRLHAGL